MHEHADNGVPAGRLLLIGGGEDRCCGTGVLISGALTRRRPDIRILTAGGPDDALRFALTLASPADPVLLTYEKLGPVQDLLAGLGATIRPA